MGTRLRVTYTHEKKGEDVPQGSGVTPQTFPGREWGRIAASPWSRFLVSVINCFVCETNRYLRDLAGRFLKIVSVIRMVNLVPLESGHVSAKGEGCLPCVARPASFSSFR